jgi:hypothetical protein
MKKVLKSKNGPDGHGFFHPKPKVSTPRTPGSPASASSKKTVRFEDDDKCAKPANVPARPPLPVSIDPPRSTPSPPPRRKVRPIRTETKISPPIDFDEDLFGPTVARVRPLSRPQTGPGSSARELSLSGTARPGTTDCSSTVPGNSKAYRISSSVTNSPSVTPPPSVSTAPSRAVQSKRTGAEGSSASEISALLSKATSQIAITPGPLITPATLVSPQAIMENAKPNLALYSHFASASASGMLLDVKMEDYKKQKGPFNYMNDTVMTGTDVADSMEDAALSSATSSAHPSQLNSAWNKRKPLSPREIMLRPLNIELPEPKEDEALFLPQDADRSWYLGYLKSWTEFNAEAIEFWKNKGIRGAFDDLKAYPIRPSATDPDITSDSHGFEILYSQFRSEVLDVMQNVYNKLMEFSRLQRDSVPDELFLGSPDEEDIGNDDMGWEPSYIIKTSGGGNDEAVRILGQAEYLGGRKGALTRAIKEVSMNSWGSLRCVLGTSSASLALEHTDVRPKNRRNFPVHAHVVEQVRFRGVWR